MPDGVVNPFSEKFLETWTLWKNFRLQQHGFQYKGCISEQVKLMQLSQMADGVEDVAIAIIMQSIGNGWSGFYKLRTVKIKANGKEQPAVDKNKTRQSVNDFYNGGNRKW